jgi:ribosomal protein S27AE
MPDNSCNTCNATGMVVEQRIESSPCTSCGASGIGSRRVEHRRIPCEHCIKSVVIHASGPRLCARCERGFILSQHERTTVCGDCQGTGIVQRTWHHDKVMC